MIKLILASSIFSALIVCFLGAAQPNILWIVTDDQRGDSLACVNQATRGMSESPLGFVSSPEIDKLAGEGTLFTHAYCNSPGCVPSRVSMLTGRYPHRNGTYGFKQSHTKADFCKPTFPEVLREAGYHTARFGKSGSYVFEWGPGLTWTEPNFYDHVVDMKNDLQRNGLTDFYKEKIRAKGKVQGTAEKFHFPNGRIETVVTEVPEGELSSGQKAQIRAIDEELDILRAYTRQQTTLIIGGRSSQPPGKSLDGEIETAFSKYISSLKSDKPLFVNLGFHFPHSPVLPPQKFRDLFAGKTYKIPEFSRDELKKLPPQLVSLYAKMQTDGLKPGEKQQAIRDYYAFCAYGDSLIGKAVKRFREVSEKANREWLVVIACGDHGWHLGEQGIEAKFGPYEYSNRCAVIALSSNKEWVPVQTSDRFVEFVDFAPTFLHAAGVDLSNPRYEYFDGQSLIDQAHRNSPPRDYVIGEMNHVYGPRAYLRGRRFAFSMRTRPNKKGSDFKWGLTAPRDQVEMSLFDLRQDPLEQDNVANDQKYLALADWFRAKLGNIVLGDGRVEADWSRENSYTIGDFAKGSHDGKLGIPAEIIPVMERSQTVTLLSPEGQRKKATHDYLFDIFAEGRETLYRGEGKDKGLKELTIFEEPREIRHGDELALPPGAEKIAGLFRHFAFHGANLDLIKEVRVFPFSPDAAPPRSKQVEDFYRVQMPSLPVSDKPYEPMKIRFLMKKESDVCRIDDLVFIAQKQIPPAFDDIPYRDLGSEHPRERVEILVDTTHELSIGGSSDLQRQRWFRTHTTPGSTHQSFEKWALERGFYPARGFMKFNPALTKGYGKNPPQLKERKDKPGSADLTFFERYDAGTTLRNAIPEYKSVPFTSCFNDWPEFMSVPLKGRGTPLIDHFDQAAELAAAYVADQVKDAGYTATWWEVKNESSVQSEWEHHWKEKQGIDGWGLLADFHNRVAGAIHKSSPGTKVGGPSSAYMQVQVGDFKLFRDQARFITETKGHLDFFSHHFYENALTLGAHERRRLGYSNYLLGRYEAILDMLRAHMHKADNVLPILITECGSLQNGREPSDNWLRLHAWNAYLTKSMQRPDQIDLFIPFIFLHMPWNPISGDAAFTPKAGVRKPWTIDDFEPTTIAGFFELWRDFDGRRLPVSFDRDWLDVVAVHNEKGVSLAVTNMGGRQLNLDLSKLAKNLGTKTAKQTRLNYHKGEVVFKPRHDVPSSAIPIDVNETTVIHIPTATPLKPSGTLTLNRWYAHETATPSAEKAHSFSIDLETPGNTKHARLIIGAYRRGGLTKPLAVTINGHSVAIDLDDAGEFSEFFAPLETTIPKAFLKEKNQIEVTSQPGTTITSVQILTHRPG